MKTSKFIILFLILSFQSFAQDAPIETTGLVASAKNFIKVNLTSIPIKNYHIQYERVLTKAISLAVSYRTMPSTTIPFKDFVLEQIGEDDPDIKKTIDNFKLKNMAITPEVRFYVGKKGFGRGFYIAPFYRYAKFESNDITLEYQGAIGPVRTITLGGDLKSNTAGLLFGTQWAIGKMFCLELQIFGPHYGGAKGLFSGTTNIPLTPDEQADLRAELENIDIPFTDKTITVTANGATMELNGPWAGVRGSIGFGFRF